MVPFAKQQTDFGSLIRDNRDASRTANELHAVLQDLRTRRQGHLVNKGKKEFADRLWIWGEKKGGIGSRKSDKAEHECVKAYSICQWRAGKTDRQTEERRGEERKLFETVEGELAR